MSDSNKEIDIWKYFEYNSVINKTRCKVYLSYGYSCGRHFPGQNVLMLKSHLSSCHSKLYAECLKGEESKFRIPKYLLNSYSEGTSLHPDTSMQSEMSPVQPETSDLFKEPTKWAPNSSEAVKRYRALTTFFISSGLPTSLAENADFRNLCETLDPRFSMPGSTVQNGLLEKEWRASIKKVKQMVYSGRRFIVSVDCWNKKSVTVLLAISVCFFNPNLKSSQHFLLNLFQTSPPYSGDMIAERLKSCLEQWEINPETVLMVITDNGSNMTKTVHLRAFSDDDDSNHDWNDDKGEEDDEFSYDVTLPLRSFPCLAQTLQLVIKDVEQNEIHSTALAKARTISRKFRKSSVATNKLVGKCGKTVFTEYSSRWSNDIPMLQRMLEIKHPLSETINEMKWNPLSANEWNKLEDIYTVLQPFADHLNRMQMESFMLSNVIPVLLDLSYHLREHKSELSDLLLKSLVTRFITILSPSNPLFDSMPCAACLLDPCVGQILLTSGMKEYLAEAKKYINQERSFPKAFVAVKAELRTRHITTAAINASCRNASKLAKNSKSLLKLQISTEANAESLDRCGSPQTQKRFKFLAKMVSESNTSSTSLEVELAQYMVELSSIQHDVIASEYWLSRQNLYINLSRLALDLTSVSVSQAYGERVFSVCGDLTARKKKKSSAHLERRVFLKMNTKLLREI